MGTMRIDADHPVGALIDAVTQTTLQTLAATERARIESDLRALQGIVDAAGEAVVQTEMSREFTQLGKKEGFKRILEKAAEALTPFDTTVERLAASIAETRAQAIAPPSLPRDTETLMLEREIRDRLVGVDRLTVNAQYLRAITENDQVFVSAIERAPAAFPLIDATTKRQGEVVRLDRSPLRAQVHALEAEHHVYSVIVGAAKRMIGQLARRNELPTDAEYSRW